MQLVTNAKGFRAAPASCKQGDAWRFEPLRLGFLRLDCLMLASQGFFAGESIGFRIFTISSLVGSYWVYLI